MEKAIKKVFDNREEKPLFYIESGSRLWGIASPDSDYDVRGIHVQSKSQYYDINRHRGIVEIMDGDFDFVSYDIDKMFTLLLKSNPTVFEWMRAHIVYYNILPNFSKFQKDVMDNIDYKALFNHYISIARGTLKEFQNEEKFTYKKLFYCIRGLLSAKLASDRLIPELSIDKLFEQFTKENKIILLAKETLEMKKQKTEKEKIPKEKREQIFIIITNFIDELQVNCPENNNNKEEMYNILKNYAFLLKNEYYNK